MDKIKVEQIEDIYGFEIQVNGSPVHLTTDKKLSDEVYNSLLKTAELINYEIQYHTLLDIPNQMVDTGDET